MHIFTGEFFHYINECLFFVGMVLFFFCASEAAFLYGRRVAARRHSDYSAQASAFGGTLLGLLALLLGFAFSMAIGRFDTRKELLLEEINDIQTTYLRADLLPAKNAAKVKELFADYTQLRLDYYQNGVLAVDMHGNVSKTEAMQKLIWNEVVDAFDFVNRNPNEGYGAAQLTLVTGAINATFDDQTKRMVSRNDHIPEAILWLLIFVAAMAMSTSAYALGFKETRLFLPRLVLIFVVSSVLSIILDLDRPTRGLIQISQSDMATLHENIVKDIQSTQAAAKK